MTITEEIKKLKVTPKSLKEFGLLVGGIFLALGAFTFWRGHAHALVFLIPGVCLLIPGLFFPAILERPYRAWMTLAFMMGWVMTRVILTALFFLTMLPISLIAKLKGHEFLDLNIKKRRPSYWVEKKPSEAVNPYEKQF